MLPRRPVIVARSAAGGFGLAFALALASGSTEWTAAIRGLVAASVCALVMPFLYDRFVDFLRPAPDAPRVPAGRAAKPAARAGGAR